jgi:hypothetical protein
MSVNVSIYIIHRMEIIYLARKNILVGAKKVLTLLLAFETICMLVVFDNRIHNDWPPVYSPMENVTMSIELFDCRISRRGKAAKGTVEVKTLGKPVISNPEEGETEIEAVKEWDYDHITSVPTSELMEFVSSNGFDLNRIIAIGFDAMQKSASIRAQNAKSELQAMLMSAGLKSVTRENVASKAQAVINAANLMGITHAEVIEAWKAKEAK